MLMPNYIFENDFIEFEQLFRTRFPDTIHVKSGQVIIGPEDPRKEYYYVIHGRASFVLRHEAGGAKVSSVRGQGTIFPLFYNFPSTNIERVLEVKARSNMELIVMPREDLLNLMLETPGIGVAMCDAYGKYTTLLLHEMTNILFDSVHIRVCDFLALQTQTSGDHISMTHDDIAELTGTTRATVTRVLNDLKNNEVISMSRKKIHILSREKLLAGCSYAVNQNTNA